MQPIAQISSEVARTIQGVFMDIDDTLTVDGKLVPDAYAALWALKNAGLRVVPVTGRPAGWCDQIARQWPVNGVIGENGALAFFEQGGRLRHTYHPAVAAPNARARWNAVRDAILKSVPGSRVARDQPYRMFDLAIDFAEEPPDLGLEAARAIQRIFEDHGAEAKISSIHVNGWWGRYDKLAMACRMAKEWWRTEPQALARHYLFCGDSPNDEPMFGFFDQAVGVANVAAFADVLKTPPRFITAGVGGYGFAEMVEVLLQRRNS